MSNDYALLDSKSKNIIFRVLEHLNSIIESMGKSINDYHLVNYDITLYIENDIFKEINEELQILVDEKDIVATKSLKFEQKYAYDMILEKVFNEELATFFIDGPDGNGKTYLYRATLATTSSVVVASILPSRRTTRSRFKMPLNIEDSTVCNVSKQSRLAKLLQTTKIIIWDEAPMLKRQPNV